MGCGASAPVAAAPLDDSKERPRSVAPASPSTQAHPVEDDARQARKKSFVVADGVSIDAETLAQTFRRVTAELNPEKATQIIIEEACSLLSVDRATLFNVDQLTGELLVKTAVGAPPLRLPKGKGVSGHVAETGRTLTIEDPYKSELFDPSSDKRTGYVSRNLLAVPALDAAGTAVAVLQAVNKLPLGEKFTSRDVVIAEHLSALAGICLRNCVVVEQLQENERRANALLDLLRALSGDLNPNSCMFTIQRRAQDLTNSEKSTFYVVDDIRDLVWSAATDSGKQIKLSRSKGIIGAVATSCKHVNIRDVYEDSRFDGSYDRATGYRTRAMLCVPIYEKDDKTGERRCTCVLQLVNKHGGGVFSPEDETFVVQLCDLVSHTIQTSGFLEVVAGHATAASERLNTSVSGEAKALNTSLATNSGGAAPGGRRRQSVGSAIVEGDEEEEEEGEEP
mmetsp:Transcript_4863/g.16960  ORF Transcript_4863/g.16960 Transcript_4863/m.16960 type:complete len:451 (-) Transcript_4863:533-1885(-)